MGLTKIKKGIRLPISGEPAQQITDGHDISQVALLGPDYIGTKPRFEVKVGDKVKLGQLLFTDKKSPQIHFTAPGSGKIQAINRGEKRRFLSIIIELDEHKEVKFCNPRIRSLITASRKPITALLKKDKIYIKCRKCGKASLSKPSSIDDRFISTNCCDTVTLFQTRFIDKVKEQKQFTA